MSYLSRLAAIIASKSSGKPRVAKLRLDSLEDRAVPATYAVTGTTLTITLDNAAETVTLNESGANINVVGSATAVAAGSFTATFGSTSGTNATILPAVTAINIVDTANNTKVFFADSGANAYAQPFTINLANTGTQVNFTGNSTFGTSFTATANTIQSSGTGNVTLTGGTSNLLLTSRGNTSLANTALVVGGTATFDKSTNSGTIDASNPGNTVAGLVDFNEVSGGTITTLKWSNGSSVAQMPVLSDLASLATVSVSHPNAPLATGAITATNSLSLTAFGDITQSGVLTSPVSSSFNVLGNSKITLSNPANEFGSLNISATHSTQALSLTDANAITLGAASVGRASLNLTATAGNITQTGSITQLPSSGGVTVTASGAASTVNLSNASNFFGGTVTVTGTPTTVSLTDSSPSANAAEFTGLPAGVTNLSLNLVNAPLVLGAFVPSTVTTLTATGTGVYQSAPLTVPTANITSINGPIVLDKANDFTSVTFQTLDRSSNPTFYDVTINDTNGLSLTGGSIPIGGRLTVTTTAGDITETGAIKTGSNSVALFKPGGNLDLSTGANQFAGRVDATVTGANTLKLNNTSAALNLGNITTATGAATISTTTSGALLQSPGTKLNIGGVSTFTAANGTSNLTNPGNKLTGAVALTSTNTFNLAATGNIILGTSTVPTLTVTANNLTTASADGAISQTGPITSTGTATFNGGLSKGDVTLTDGGNNFGTVAGRVNGTGNFALTDTNAVALGSLLLGNGNLNVTANGNISQTASLRTVGTTSGTSGTGTVTLNAGANTVSLANAGNEFNGKLTIAGGATSLSVFNRGNIDLASTAQSIAATAPVTLKAGNTVTLPTAPLTVSSLATSASKTLIQGDVTATGTISIAGASTIGIPAAAGVTLSASSASFNGDATVTKPLTFNTTTGVAINGGTWTQGANSLTISTGGLTISNAGTRFVTSGNTAIGLTAGNLTVGVGAVFQVGNQPAVGETATVTTTGTIILNGDLQVGLGATGDQLAKVGTGNVALSVGTSHLIGTGVATATPLPVISVTGGGNVTGQFLDSVTPGTTTTIPFQAGGDFVQADYSTPTSVGVKSGAASDTDGTVTGFLQDGQAYTVTSSLGAAAGLVVTEKLDSSGNDLGLDIVVRTNTAASTLTITPTVAGTNGTGTVLIHSISVSGVGAVTITAPLANLVNGTITTQSTLTAATLRNITGSTITTDTGRTALTAGTIFTAKLVDNSTIDIGGVLTTFTAEDVQSSLTTTSLIAEKFGTIKTTGSTVQGSTAGDLKASLTTRTPTVGTNVASVTVAGTLSGLWDVLGDIGTIKARITSGWTLGRSLTTVTAGAGVRNPDGVRNITTSLDIGRSAAGETAVAITATGNIKALLTTDFTSTGSSVRAGSIGSITTKTNPADFVNGANGNLSANILTTGNLAGTAVGTITVAGNYTMGSNKLIAWNGNIGTIKATKTLSGVITTFTYPTTGGITALAGGTIEGLSVTAKRVGSITGVVNAAAQQFGDIGVSVGNTFNLQGNDGTAAKNAIGTITAGRNLASNTFNLLGGNLGSITVPYRSSNNTFKLSDSTAGRVGSFTVGESTSDNFAFVESIGNVTAKGVAQTLASTAPQLGNFSNFTLNTYRETGTVAGIGAVKAAANISGTLTAPNGITSITAGRDLSGVITTDSPVPGTDVVGRVGSITAGSISSGITLVGESVGAIKTTGYLTPESGATSRIAGVFNASELLLKGTGVASGVGVGAITTDSSISTVTVDAPFGVTSITAKGQVNTLFVTADDLPLALATVKPGYGKVGSITGFDLSNIFVAAASIGTVKSSADYLSNSRGSISVSEFVARDTAATATGITSITTDGSFAGNVAVIAPAGLGSLTVDESLASGLIAAGYAANKSIGTIKAGDVAGFVILARQLGSFNVIGNQEPGSSLGGGVIAAYVNVFGNTAGVGLGTFSALGTVSGGTIFDITDGNLTSFTAARLQNSTIQVGARFQKGNAVANGATFGLTDRSLGSLSLTAPFFGASPSPEDRRDGSGFRDSYVAAANIGTVTVASVAATLNPLTEEDGVTYKSGAAAAGTVSVGGVTIVNDQLAIDGSKFAKRPSI
ncbi:beta strand repeat-containing protein [Zavarzinella formosa]|uniref:beta strand repeat-containing protein n=1 Tax=Zavarzinella formosa TaxID=360055 RepID=UPI00031AF31C|nr:hypothetical protein [Zavarzinella formosa]